MAHTSFSSFLSWAGKFLTALFVLIIFILSKNICFQSAFRPFSLLSGLKGSKRHNKTFHNSFCAWLWDLYLRAGSALVCGNYAWGWDLRSKFLGISAWVFISQSSFCSQKEWCTVSVFALLIVRLLYILSWQSK